MLWVHFTERWQVGQLTILGVSGTVHQGLMQGVDLLMQVIEILIIGYNVVGQTQTSRAFHLSIKNGLDLGAGIIVPRHGPLDLRLHRNVDHDGGVTPTVLTGLKQKRVNQQAIGASAGVYLFAEIILN